VSADSPTGSPIYWITPVYLRSEIFHVESSQIRITVSVATRLFPNCAAGLTTHARIGANEAENNVDRYHPAVTAAKQLLDRTSLAARRVPRNIG
jgi:hypothetical protein